MKITITKIGNNYCMSFDGRDFSFCKSSSDILTAGSSDKELGITSDTNYNGIFSVSNSAIWFFQGTIKHLINFTNVWNPANYNDPLLEIKRRVNLVRDTFAKAEAEKEVWEGLVGDLPLVVEPDVKRETYTIVYVGSQGDAYKDVVNLTMEEFPAKLRSYANPIFVFKGDITKTV